MNYVLRNGENVWINEDGEKVKCSSRPVRPGDWYPAYPASRVHGDRYEFYSGSSAWVKAANASMKQAANDHFRGND